jgi:pSer/pThr/pTyr-binding forkhead associated (FHA) protein
MDCVIKVIQGPETGQEFRCSGAETILGRSPRSHVRLASPSVSFEHAVIVRSGDEFYAENLSAAGTFINEEKISGRVRLRAKDRLRVGQETIVRVEALPKAGVELGRRRMLIIAVLVMLLLLVIVLVIDPLGAAQRSVNWKAVYPKIDEWARGEVQAGKLPSEVTQHLEQGWRLREAGDTVGAKKEWMRLRVMLAGVEEKTGLQAASDADRGALGRLLNPPKDAREPDDDQLGAAMVQFVARMVREK